MSTKSQVDDCGGRQKLCCFYLDNLVLPESPEYIPNEILDVDR